MIYLELLIGFLKVGLFSFGGAYAAIPLIREVVLSYGWVTEEMLTDMIAVSESTPGPIMVNLATYVGTSQAGIPGAIIATLASILPAFVLILLIMEVMKHTLNNKYAQAVMRGLQSCVIGVITAVGIHMLYKNAILPLTGEETDWRPLVLAVVLAVIYFGSRKIKKLKKGISPILLIGISAVLGIIIF
ncbi:chromate transporter [Clostridiales bacterium FE2010]|nr:chromate transporter [Clostridiales bacterium FE2010]